MKISSSLYTGTLISMWLVWLLMLFLAGAGIGTLFLVPSTVREIGFGTGLLVILLAALFLAMPARALYTNRGNLARGRRKYLFLPDTEAMLQSRIREKETLGDSKTLIEKKERETKEEIRQHWLSIERNRKAREVYEIREISGWMYTGALLGMLMAIVAGLMIWASGTANAGDLWWFVGIGLAPLMLLGFASDLDTSWKASVSAKTELEAANPKTDTDGHFNYQTYSLNGNRYKNDYLYTDSSIFYWLYVVTKFVLGLTTIVFGIGAAILLFMWLGTISVAPTTIIIILLVMILLKQK